MLLTRSPLGPKTSFDLHVLSTPPAFVLSQDQTLHRDLGLAGPHKGNDFRLRSVEEPPPSSLSSLATRHWIHTLSMCVTQCIDLVNAPNLSDKSERSRAPALAFVTTIPFSKSDDRVSGGTRGGNPAPGQHTSPWGRCPCQEPT